MMVSIAPGCFLHHIFQSTCGLMATTPARHAEGRQFDAGPGVFSWSQIKSSLLRLLVCEQNCENTPSQDRTGDLQLFG